MLQTKLSSRSKSGLLFPAERSLVQAVARYCEASEGLRTLRLPGKFSSVFPHGRSAQSSLVDQRACAVETVEQDQVVEVYPSLFCTNVLSTVSVKRTGRVEECVVHRKVVHLHVLHAIRKYSQIFALLSATEKKTLRPNTCRKQLGHGTAPRATRARALAAGGS